MIKISVEGATTLELSLKLLEIGRLLAAEPVPHASEGKPTKPRKEKPGPPPEAPAASPAASAPDAAETSSPASTPAAGSENPPPAPAPAPAPADDSQAVEKARAALRAILSGKVKNGLKDKVNELVTSYAPVLSQVPADKLAELTEKAEAL